MLNVHRYNVPDPTSGKNEYFSLDLQVGARVLGLQSQEVKYEKPKIWVLADSTNPSDKRREFLLVIGCNVIKEKPEDLIYIGTRRAWIVEGKSSAPFHLFEIKK